MKVIIKKISRHFQTGDLIYCFDETMNRGIYGYIINITRNENGTQDLMIRWTDLFVAIEYCNSVEALSRIKKGLWSYKPLSRSKYGKVRAHSGYTHKESKVPLRIPNGFQETL